MLRVLGAISIVATLAACASGAPDPTTAGWTTLNGKPDGRPVVAGRMPDGSIDNRPVYQRIADADAKSCPDEWSTDIKVVQAAMACHNQVAAAMTYQPHNVLVDTVNSVINAPAQPGCVALSCGRETAYDAHGHEIGTAYGTPNGGVNYFGKDGSTILEGP